MFLLLILFLLPQGSISNGLPYTFKNCSGSLKYCIYPNFELLFDLTTPVSKTISRIQMITIDVSQFRINNQLYVGRPNKTDPEEKDQVCNLKICFLESYHVYDNDTFWIGFIFHLTTVDKRLKYYTIPYGKYDFPLVLCPIKNTYVSKKSGLIYINYNTNVLDIDEYTFYEVYRLQPPSFIPEDGVKYFTCGYIKNYEYLSTIGYDFGMIKYEPTFEIEYVNFTSKIPSCSNGNSFENSFVYIISIEDKDGNFVNMRIKESNHTKKPNFESMYLFYSKSDVEKMKNKNDINLSPLYGIEDLNSYILPKCAVKFNLLKAEVKLVDSNDEEVKMDDNNTIFFPPYMLDRKPKFKCKIFVEGNQKEVEDFYSKGIVVSPYRISNNNVNEKLKLKGYRETNEEKMEKYVCLLESYKAKNLELVKNYIKNNISFKMKLRNDLREISWESTKDMYIDCYIKYKNSIFFEEMVVILNNKYEFRTSNDNDKIYFEMSDKYVIFLFRNFGDDGDDIEEAFIDCRYKASGRSNLSIRTRGVLRNKNYYLRSEVTENDDTLFYVFGIGGIILISFILLISIMGILFYYMVLKELMGDNNLADKKEELKNVSS